MYRPVTEEIPPGEFPADDEEDSPSADEADTGERGGGGGERRGRPEYRSSEGTGVGGDRGGVGGGGGGGRCSGDLAVGFSSGRGGSGQQQEEETGQQSRPYRQGDLASGPALAHQPAWLYLQWEPRYLSTWPGMMKILHLVVTLTALICATSICYRGNDYLSLPSPWKFRVFVFTSVFSLLCCLGLLFCRTTNLARVLPLDWLLLDIVLSCIISFLYFLSSCMIASASAAYNRTFDDADWTASNKLVAGVVLGYTLFLLHAIHVLSICVRYKKRTQFRHQLLQVDSGSMDSVQPQV